MSGCIKEIIVVHGQDLGLLLNQHGDVLPLMMEHHGELRECASHAQVEDRSQIDERHHRATKLDHATESRWGTWNRCDGIDDEDFADVPNVENKLLAARREETHFPGLSPAASSN